MRSIALTLAVGVVVTATAFAACGGSNGQGPNGGGHGPDGGASGSGSGGASSGGTSSGGTASSGTASSGTASSGSGVDSGGCPPYQIMCNGACVLQTGVANCGGCGKTCNAGQACLGGTCTSTCPTGSGLTVCGGICTDTQTDNNNCGTCGTTCGANMGCVGGSCGAAKTFPTPPMCTGGGPPVVVSPGGGSSQCLGNVAQTTFTWSMCSCKNITFQDNALVDGWNSQAGPYVPGQLGGGVGANNEITSMSGADIWGQAWADSKATSFSAVGNVHYDLQSGGDILGDGLNVTHDAYVVGNITGNMTVAHTLYQTPGKASAGLTPVPLTTPVVAPCDCMHPIPVVSTVAWAKTNNDNMAIGLDPAIMTQPNHPTRIDLPCGIYYLQGFSSGGLIVGHGNVAVFIDGNVASSGLLTMTIADPTSQLDVWISGTITATSQFSFGSGAYPALSRLYVGGTQTLDIQVGAVIGGELWAGNAPVLWESDTDMFGALFVGDINILSRFALHQDQAVVTVGSSTCPPPGGGSGSSSGGSGSSSGGTTSSSGSAPPPMCGTCKDCGNQACINGKCGSCTTNGDCCAPLICQGGTCVPLLH